MRMDGITEQELLAASPDEYWSGIEREVTAAGRGVRHASLLNHEAAHLLAWAKIARDRAIQRRNEIE